ncbi:MAG: CoA-binding protein [Deinococcota bacterium]|jgi:predicted CoA-binding protein|nr:CoA-binding protein [Deinococcota bacterium]
MAILNSLEDIKRVLEGAQTIAVLGANPKTDRPAHYVPAYLRSQGYRILPVNSAHEGKEMFGERVRPRLSELGEPVDIVNVFRRSRDVPGHLDDILAMSPKPKVVWLQLGIQSDEAAAALTEAGIAVVQNRCLLVDHRTLL